VGGFRPIFSMLSKSVGVVIRPSLCMLRPQGGPKMAQFFCTP